MPSQTPPSPTPPNLQTIPLPAGLAGRVEVRLLDLASAEAALPLALSLLSAAERARARRYRHPVDTQSFALTRASLRQWLATQLGQATERIDIITGPHGKPRLADGALHFNVAHAGRYALLALSATHEIGVDIEAIDHQRPWADIARQAFSAQEQALSSDAESFYRIWTAKEAVVKSWGSGIDDALTSFSAIPAEGRLQLLASTWLPQLPHTEAWSLPAPEGYAAALAVLGDDLP
ncbi:4'-phosphopantetheinyl transferase family protein [Uliginosibacterium sediminicola]|uniref:4'-phosphopantetheinyl transferase superfamily protein n=1 Tax=Uliginosibacterium sediminicola TaxID=2024550 RepID=A0ABU9Z3Z0_9RHOO